MILGSCARGNSPPPLLIWNFDCVSNVLHIASFIASDSLAVFAAGAYLNDRQRRVLDS